MLMIPTRWQKNLHIAFLTKHSLLDSRYRSSVYHFCGVMDNAVINLSTCQCYTCLIFHFESFFFNKVYIKIRAMIIVLCATFLFIPQFDVVCDLLLN